MEVVDCGKWFYAVHKEKDAKENLAFRADFDAVASKNGTGESVPNYESRKRLKKYTGFIIFQGILREQFC